MSVLKKIIRKFRECCVRTSTPIEQAKIDYEWLVSQGVETELGYVTLIGRPIISKAEGTRIVLGKGVTLVSDAGWNEAGINHPVILSASVPGAEIIIHDGVGMSGTSIVATKKIEIGENTALGANTNIYDTDFHCCKYEDRLKQKSIADAPAAPIFIDKHCWLASNVTVLKGVTIGENVVVGAMSLVNKSIPANKIAAGVPAKVIKENI